MVNPADLLPPAPGDRDWPLTADYVNRGLHGRRILSADPHRPRYHVTAPAGWLNDPNGILHHEGKWHLFYQHNPRAGFHADMHWGYLVSDDLVHWTDRPCAIIPTDGTYDSSGIWSGNAVIDDAGVPTLFYTGVAPGTDGPYQHQLVCIARTYDGFQTFVKDPANPVIPTTPPGMDLVQYRDPFVWRGRAGSPAKWLLAIGAGFPGIGGTALVYGSDDLRHWEYLHPMLVGDLSATSPVSTGTMWECPDFFEMDGRGVLLLNAWGMGNHHTVAVTGEMDETGTRLRNGHYSHLDGGEFYAPQSMWDGNGRRVQWGWLREGRPSAAGTAAGWSGAMSLPRILRVTSDGRVAGSPAPELRSLRRDHVALGASHPTQVHGGSLELELRFDHPYHGRSGAWVRCSPDDEERTFAGYDPEAGGVIIDRSASSLDPEVASTVVITPVTVDIHSPFTIRIFLDASVLEVFLEDATGCIANLGGRIYPSRTDSLQSRVHGEAFAGGDSWVMAGIWPD
ncbi:MAG: glycoside hydrolase family 32 protein [Chloroflexi bacterium]|nr:MAG: glycoside hydrolase family 32 protein [Chloroflexota bacterium]